MDTLKCSTNESKDDSKMKKRKYSAFLKRKRIEKKLTLEEVSKDICTPSYLSRIENNLVDVNEEYYDLLFKKMDIDYSCLKEEKNSDIFINILEKYLLQEFDDVSKLIDDALKTNYYVEIEYELMVLFDNISKDLFTESHEQLLVLNKSAETFVDDEFIIFFYLSTLYAYKTNQCVFARDQALTMSEINDIMPIYRFAFYDIALDIFYRIGDYGHYFGLLQKFNLLENRSLYTNVALKHQAQEIILKKVPKQIFACTDLFKIIDIVNNKESDYISLEIIKRCFDYDEKTLFSYILQVNPSYESLAIEAILALKMKNNYNFSEITKKFNSVKGKFFDDCFKKLVILCENIYQNKNRFENYLMVKSLLKHFITQNGDIFFIKQLSYIFTEMALLNGKYKEGLKYLLELKAVEYLKYN